MKIVVKHDVELSQHLNSLLNAPTVTDLLMEAEGLIYEIECRMLKTAEDHKSLEAARDRVLRVVRARKPRQRT